MSEKVFPEVSRNSVFEDVRVRENRGEIEFVGTETGKITKIRHEGNKAIFRINGHNYWSGRGTTSYAHPSYLVGIYKEEVFFCVKEIEYNRKTMRKAREIAEEIYEGIE